MKQSLEFQKQPDWSKMGDLIPAIVQDVDTGRILMLAYMNPASWEATLTSGQAYFWSRSRQSLWKKGDTSGNVLNVTELALDCDSDAILVLARPTGPTCHKGSRSCFLSDDTIHFFEFLPFLQDVIRKRIEKGSEESYVRRLVEKNEDEAARKVGEEAIEVILASRLEAADLVAESADLIFHLLVLMTRQGVSYDEVIAELMARRPHGNSVDLNHGKVGRDP